jgi:GNAT superfamily N-acetyltransferase
MSRTLDATLPRGWDTAAAALAACARALGDPRSPSEIAAASGLAFRIAVDQRVTPAGPHGYPWREELTLAAERLGYRWRLVACAPDEPLWEIARADAFALCKEGIEAGRPTLLFGIHVAEFGIARGCDGDQLIVSGALDGGAPPQLSREALGEAGTLFALQLTERLAVDEKRAARALLRAAICAHRGEAATVGGFASGAAAWRALADALVSGAIDPTGLAYSAARFAEARDAVARHLPVAAKALAIELEDAARAARRTASMLAELSRLCPFPPPATEMLTTTKREQAAELVAEASRAEAEMIAALERAVIAEQRAAATRSLRLVELDTTTLPDLFACVDEIPIAGLRDDAARCRRELAPTVGKSLSGRLIYRDDRLIGHILWSPLDEARYPVAAAGTRWFVYCPWIERTARGQGIGTQLFAALDQAARAAAVDGLLTVATSIDVFLHHRTYEPHGFVEVDRRGDTRLLEKKLSTAQSGARLVDPPNPKRSGKLPVVVRHAYNCPLLLHVRDEAAGAARAIAGVTVDEAAATRNQPSGITIAGRAVAHGPVPAAAVAQGIAAELEDWR